MNASLDVKAGAGTTQLTSLQLHDAAAGRVQSALPCSRWNQMCANDWTGVRRQGSLVQGWRWLWQHAMTGAAQLQDAVLAVLQIPNMREVQRRVVAQHLPEQPKCT